MIDINDLVVGRSYYFWINGEEHLSELVDMSNGHVELANGYICSISDFLTSAEMSDISADVSSKPNFSDVRFNGGEPDEYVPNIKLDHNGVPIIPKSAMDMDGMSDLIDTDFDEPITYESKKTKKKLNVSLSEKLKKLPCTLSLNLTIPDKETVNTICDLMTIEKSEIVESIFNDIYDQIDESVKTAINNFYE
jgi:hypothetical protein